MVDNWGGLHIYIYTHSFVHVWRDRDICVDRQVGLNILTNPISRYVSGICYYSYVRIWTLIWANA